MASVRKAAFKKKEKPVDVKTEKKRHKGSENLVPIQKGQVLNPAGRPVGSRTKFAETFLKKFLLDFEEHGERVIADVRIDDPSTYLRVAASILPKELNLIKDESALDKILDQCSIEQLDTILAGIAAAGIASKGGRPQNQKAIRGESNRVH